ncbi:N2-dimethylguanosine tRNA methyltransferase family protein [Theileria parva strain Muguga]|uniref:tRNA (guanine(26)-N(2))-dimethyltransferase n=1 Tax=Theileria parva TaxID=5875 RepID=Q4N4W5_THEPA|nr:N2-dimethylguanosine tRNA methyltransferase family protein [Theileria parva strain Muguga]EAN32808.1 N2-dimethylguanosine tRNA methyltransferase family protein [Theileria parva strain Muguga]|eukprot:XP_765091.1 N2,N2-dimethylguanosine tRNA methyltransferase [Theileria parva strain Muguga]
MTETSIKESLIEESLILEPLIEESLIREGLVVVNGRGPDNKLLFYNPPQVFNRDLSLLVLKTFILQEKKKIESDPKLGNFIGVNILESLAATGIRGIRYLRELGPLVGMVTFNDLDRNSAEMILKNLTLNSMPRSKYRVTCCDANFLSNILTPPPDITKHFLMSNNIYKAPVGSYNNNTNINNILKQYNHTMDQHINLLLLNPSDGDTTDPVNSTDQSIFRNVVDIIDLDPYSSVTSYVDSAVRCVRSGGMLLITSTDMPTLCGNNPLVSFYKYGGTSFKSPFCHELSLRVLLYSVMLTASKYKRVIEPLVSCSIDFYVRVFVKVVYSPEQCKRVGQNSGLILLCVRCHSYHILPLCQDYTGSISESGKGVEGGNTVSHKKRKVEGIDWSRKCEECGSRIKIGGPIYTGPLHNHEFVQATLQTLDTDHSSSNTTQNTIGNDTQNTMENTVDGTAESVDIGITMWKRIRGLLTTINEEVDVPLYYSISDLCQIWSLTTISPILFKGVLRGLGYKASNFHRDPNSIKTNAPNQVVMDIIRTHAKNTSKTSNHSFFSKPIQTVGIDLDMKVAKVKDVPRWFPNPTSHWGPKKMHKTTSTSLI